MDQNTGEQVVERSARAEVAIDRGLRDYMLEVYNWMFLGLVLTGAVAVAVTQIDQLADLFYQTVRTPRGLYTKLTLLGWAALLAPLGLCILMSYLVESMSAAVAQAVYWLYAAIMGVALAPIAAVYTGESIGKVFFISAATFGVMSLYGYTTKRDLSGWGDLLLMGLIGIIIAMVVNFFLMSSALSFAISVIGVLVFVGLTAYDTQKIKAMYDADDDSEVATKKSIMGALELYLDFINIFLFLLRLFGARK